MPTTTENDMDDVLILYASNHGHTAKIAARIAKAVAAADARPHLLDVCAGADPAAAHYDLVVAGASVHNDHHQRQMVEWARRHAAALSLVPSAFFSVSLTAADDTDEARTITRRYLDEFLEETGWMPNRTAAFAGSLQYREYDFGTRLLMRLLMARAHHPTSIDEDFEYTDWAAVDAFAADCLAMRPTQESYSASKTPA